MAACKRVHAYSLDEARGWLICDTVVWQKRPFALAQTATLRHPRAWLPHSSNIATREKALPKLTERQTDIHSAPTVILRFVACTTASV